MEPLSPADRRKLKALAHSLKPVVMIGNDGLTPGVLAEIERALKSHELIKIRVHGDDRDARLAWLASICEFTAAAPVQHIGKLLTIYRSNPELSPEPTTTPVRRKTPERTPRTDARRNKGWQAPGTTPRSRSSSPAGPARERNADGSYQRPRRPTTHSRRADPSTPYESAEGPAGRRTPRRRPG